MSSELFQPGRIYSHYLSVRNRIMKLIIQVALYYLIRFSEIQEAIAMDRPYSQLETRYS